MHKFFLSFLLLTTCNFLTAQDTLSVYYKGAIKEKKAVMERNIAGSIQRNLSLPLSIDTEDNWAGAFASMEVTKYHTAFTDAKINMGFDSIDRLTPYFQRSLLELVYASQKNEYTDKVQALINRTADAKVFAMCAEYLLYHNPNAVTEKFIKTKQSLAINSKDSAILQQLTQHVARLAKPSFVSLQTVLSNNFLPGYRILFSFQRRNRNYTGLAMIRDSLGNFLKDDKGNYFSVPQLARSISNLPGYLTNGNTPQGIFRMYGFDVSKSNFIGPTPNIQLTMPYETSVKRFMNDSTITDSVWSLNWYAKLLPASLKNNSALYESFYAGKAGRTEIIAHGTTVDPEWYHDDPYYPQTPTVGCLCTKEWWSDIDGRLLYSDQQKLANAIAKAGGPYGYCVVIEIDDEAKPVTVKDIIPYIKE